MQLPFEAIGKVAPGAYAARVADSGFRLGIDFGTSNTVAVLRWPDGRTKPLLFDGSPLLPSAVYVNADGTILTGRDAVHSARLQPHRFEPYPKRRVEESVVWLGERDVPVLELVASVLRRVAAEAERVAGAKPGQVMITHPATWPPQRRQTLAQAATAAGLPAPLLSPEPVAAASYFVGTVGTHVPVGGVAVVYDFGAGTFDASVVRRNAGGGFDVLVSEGLPDAGGLDVDAAVVAYLGRNFAGREGDQWRRLTNPESETDRRAAWQLWEDARLAKEMLSRAATTYVHVPLFDESVPIGREQLEQLAKPILDRTVTTTQIALRSAGVAQSPVVAVFLVGGSSRIPLAATLLHRAMGLAPTAIEQPELVVAEGALHLAPPTGRAAVGGVGATGSPIVPSPISGGPRPTSGGGTPAGPGGTEPSGDVAASPVSGVPTSGQPVSGQPVSGEPAFSMPSLTPHLPPLLQTGSMPIVPTQPTSGQPVSPPPVPNQPRPVSTPPSPVSTPPVQQPPMVQRPPVQQPVGYQQQRPPVYQPPVVQQPPVAHRPPVQPVSVPQIPVQQPPPAWQQPVQPPNQKRSGALVAAIGGSVLALLLVVGGLIWWVNRDGGDEPGGDPSKQAAPAVSPACGNKIAYLGMASGTNSEDGVMMRNSVKMAVEDFNTKNPSCGVEFAEFDTQGKEDLSKSKAQDLADDPKIMGVVGPVYRNEILAAGPILDEAGVPMITPFSPDDDLTTRGWATFHRIIGSDTDQAAAGGRYLKNVLKAKKVVIVYDDTDFGTVGRKGASDALGPTASSTVSIRRADKDFASAVKQVTDANPDGVYFAGQADDGAIFVKALRTAKPTIAVVAADRIFTQGFVNNTAGAADGVVITCPCLPPEKAGDDFGSRYQAKYGKTATYYGPESYDAANVYLAGLLAGKGTRADMQAFVKSYDGKGVSRSIKFDRDGNLNVPDPVIWSYKVANPYVKPDAKIAP
ncbi:hypothetical protein GCM10010399_74280 [Dactylosporangium fulvum]